jgi:RHS repeat-associated protein
VLVYFGVETIQEGSYGSTLSLSYVTADRLGSMPGGAKLDPYGREITATANDKVKFATYLRDGESGIDYAMNRYYAAGRGRFLSADPYRGSAGPGDPGSWNRYGYASNDPINGFDPLGWCTATVTAGGDSVSSEYDCNVPPWPRTQQAPLGSITDYDDTHSNPRKETALAFRAALNSFKRAAKTIAKKTNFKKDCVEDFSKLGVTAAQVQDDAAHVQFFGCGWQHDPDVQPVRLFSSSKRTTGGELRAGNGGLFHRKPCGNGWGSAVG